jgi:hypothetical protein
MDNAQPSDVVREIGIDTPNISDHDKEDNGVLTQLAVLRDRPSPFEAHQDLATLARADSTLEELKASVPLLLGRLIEHYDPLAKPYLCYALDASIDKILEHAKANGETSVDFGTHEFQYKGVHASVCLDKKGSVTAFLNSKCHPKHASLIKPFTVASMFGGRDDFTANMRLYDMYMKHKQEYPSLAEYMEVLKPIAQMKRSDTETKAILDVCMEQCGTGRLGNRKDTCDIIHGMGFTVAKKSVSDKLYNERYGGDAQPLAIGSGGDAPPTPQPSECTCECIHLCACLQS